MQTQAGINYPKRRAGFFKWVEFQRTKEQVEKRFWDKVEKGDPDDCWEWKASKNEGRYGIINFYGKNTVASRASWIIANGTIPEGFDVMHHCDNPSCVNPKHLKAVPTIENIHDCIAKGRRRYTVGSESHYAKLTETEVLKIRRIHASGEKTMAQMARERGVDHECIRMIVKRISWRHI